jgi:ATP-dependent Lhr-like helicase
MAQAGQLLAQYGVVTRDAVAAEGLPGGFAGLYPVLAALEDRGRVRRGYFVAGLGGSQFADPGAVDRLRGLRAEDAGTTPSSVLAATDPANPFGLVLPWPEGGRCSRTPGAHVVLAEGRLVAYLTREQRQLHAFLPEEEPERTRLGRAAARALRSWAQRTGRFRLGWSPAETETGLGGLRPFLLETGFVPSGPGARLGS